jgi:hypothetical protein
MFCCKRTQLLNNETSLGNVPAAATLLIAGEVPSVGIASSQTLPAHPPPPT